MIEELWRVSSLLHYRINYQLSQITPRKEGQAYNFLSTHVAQAMAKPNQETSLQDHNIKNTTVTIKGRIGRCMPPSASAPDLQPKYNGLNFVLKRSRAAFKVTVCGLRAQKNTTGKYYAVPLVTPFYL